MSRATYSVLLVGLLAVGAVARLAAAAPRSFELPPLMQPPAAEHPGKLIWAELVAPDLAAAERFYGGIFGWTFHDIRTGDANYAIAKLGDAPIAGLVQRPVQSERRRQAAWLPFLSVSSVQEAGQRVLEHGGKELKPPRAYRMRGKQAIYADPQGAVFAVLNSHSGDPPDVLAAPGEWIWGAVMTRDPESAAAFYQNVFGYEVFELPSGARGAHLLLASQDYARASVNPLPQADAAQPHWIGFVRVSDVPHAADAAKTFGGRVLVEPHPDRHGGTVALLAGPAYGYDLDYYGPPVIYGGWGPEYYVGPPRWGEHPHGFSGPPRGDGDRPHFRPAAPGRATPSIPSGPRGGGMRGAPARR